MNFFEHQQQARQNTKRLLVLFVLAVLAIIAATTLLTTLVTVSYLTSETALLTQEAFFAAFLHIGKYTAPLIAFTVAIVSHTRLNYLSVGGYRIAQSLGGSPLELKPENLKERQLQNIVEEMAIASGLPVPEIYILREEAGINAFAAGMKPSDAVIGITQGALDHLNRDELQGVIAHEISHILNGDMNLNANLMGILSGILFLSTVGQGIVDAIQRGRGSSRKRKGLEPLMLLGVGLFIIGWIGVFFGRWIKAAVSREREFLADASAVQFTRNPQGLGSALAKIQALGSGVKAPLAEEASHLFLGSVRNFALFATHPPLKERLKRLGQVQLLEAARLRPMVQRVGKPAPRSLEVATTVLQGLSAVVHEQVHQPREAMQMILALLARDRGALRNRVQIDPAVLEMIKSIPDESKLTVVDLALPALRRLEVTQGLQLLQTLELLVKEDQQVTALEIAILSIVRRQLTQGRKRQGSLTLSKLVPESLEVLKALARSEPDSQTAKLAYQAGATALGISHSFSEAYWHKGSIDPLGVDKALVRLSHLLPMAKEHFFKSVLLTVHYDQHLSVTEAHYLRAFSEALEIPLPAA